MADESSAQILRLVLAEFLSKAAQAPDPSDLSVKVWGDQAPLIYMLSMREEEAALLRRPIHHLTGRAWTTGTSIILYDRDVEIILEKLPFVQGSN